MLVEVMNHSRSLSKCLSDELQSAEVMKPSFEYQAVKVIHSGYILNLLAPSSSV